MHPSTELRGTRSRRLEGRKIVLGVTGSIAAVESVKLIRELIRHGAEVFPVMSSAAERIIHPDALEFASGQVPVTRLTGQVEHVALCGKVADRAGLLLIAPCTSNTISKMACGIDDTPVTTFASTAIGTGIPVMVAPAMHESMYAHPVVIENIEKLRKLGVDIIAPRLQENKAKIASIEDIVLTVLRKFGRGDYTNRRVLVIAGATREPIDDVRCITNYSTGKTGMELAYAAWTRGAKVDVWYGASPEIPPHLFSVKRFESVESLIQLVSESKLDFDVVLVPAAISDYSTEKVQNKINSEMELNLSLRPAPKVIRTLRRRFKGALVGFKAEVRITDDQLEKKAREMMDAADAEMAIANDMMNVKDDATQVLIVPRKGDVRKFSGPKTDAADAILDEVVKLL